jgi:Mn2+/Fe2+ NRAMP family transporter
MGAVTGKGFADLVREQFGVRPTAFVMATLLVANAGLIVSEFAGIGAAAELFGISRWIAIPAMVTAIWLLVARGSYERVEKVFLALALVFLAYPISAVVARPDSRDVARHIVRPDFTFDARYLTLLIALVGTTITPYMQLFMQSATAEKGSEPDAVRADAYGGAIFSNIVSITIIVATGATLFAEGIRVQTADDAARALEPLVGRAAPYLFGGGLFGASVLAAAVLPIATAYTVTEAFGFEKGVSRSFREAPVFHGLFLGLLVVGAVGAVIPGLNVIDLLVGTQVLNGVVLPVVLIAILLLAGSREQMGGHANGPARSVLAWVTVGVVTLLSSSYLLVTIGRLLGV